MWVGLLGDTAAGGKSTVPSRTVICSADPLDIAHELGPRAGVAHVEGTCYPNPPPDDATPLTPPGAFVAEVAVRLYDPATRDDALATVDAAPGQSLGDLMRLLLCTGNLARDVERGPGEPAMSWLRVGGVHAGGRYWPRPGREVESRGDLVASSRTWTVELHDDAGDVLSSTPMWEGELPHSETKATVVKAFVELLGDARAVVVAFNGDAIHRAHLSPRCPVVTIEDAAVAAGLVRVRWRARL